MKQIIIVSLILLSTKALFGHSNDLQVSEQSRELLDKSDSAQFTIEKNLVEKLFSQSVSEQPSMGESSFLMDLGFGQFYPQEMNLKNKYFSVSYKDNLRAFSLISASLAKRILQGKMNLLVRTGYAYTQGVFKVHGETGSDHSDSVSTQWIPVQAGVSADVFSIAFIKFKTQMGLGEDIISQTGTLDGISQNFTIPHIFGGFSLSLFEQRNQSGFEGVSLTSQYQKSFDREQSMKGWSFAISSRFVL